DAVGGVVVRPETFRAGDGEVFCGEGDVDVLRPHPRQVAVDDQVLSTGEDVRGGPPEFHTTEGAVQTDGARCVGDPIHLTDEGPCSVEKFADTSPVVSHDVHALLLLATEARPVFRSIPVRSGPPLCTEVPCAEEVWKGVLPRTVPMRRVTSMMFRRSALTRDRAEYLPPIFTPEGSRTQRFGDKVLVTSAEVPRFPSHRPSGVPRRFGKKRPIG